MHLIKEQYGRLIREEALRLGFDDVGFSPAQELVEDRERLKKWLDNGHNAEMGYMANHFEKRLNPALLVEGACSVVTLLKNYYPADDKLSRNEPKISRYAYGKDYHDLIRTKLTNLFDFIRDNIEPGLIGRGFVDSAPILERSIAANAGLGWIGKNSLLIHRKMGSYVFIAELIINLELPYNQQTQNDGCGGCTRCVDSCPTQAIIEGRQVDANRCISYLTIENKGEIPSEFKGMMAGWVFGCDICQEVCPWNRKAKSTSEPGFMPSKALLDMDSEKWQQLTPDYFSILFRGSPIKRAKYSGLMRNLMFVKSS